MSSCKYEVTHPTTDDVVVADFDDTSTPGEFKSQLEQQAWLPPAKNGAYAVVVTKANRSLADDETFAAQNVPDGTALSFRVRANGAAPRRVGPTVGRLQLDYESLKDLEGRGCFGKIDAFAARDLKRPIRSVRGAGRMRCYAADLRMRLPVDRNGFHDSWRLVVDLEPSWASYPSAEHKPHVRIVGRQPLHYRLSPSGVLCTLPVGSRHYVAGQHLGMIVGLLNGEEPFENRHDEGYRPDAYRFYRDRFNGPVTPGLDIPSVRETVFLGDPAPVVDSAPLPVKLSPLRPAAAASVSSISVPPVVLTLSRPE